MSQLPDTLANPSRTVPAGKTRQLALAVALTALGFNSPASAETRLLWGDLHLHSNYSTDAYATGNTGVTPDMAYRFARGIPIVHPVLDTKVKIDRPLDFLAVTDHAINLGIDVMIREGDPVLQATERGRALIEAGGGDQNWPGFMRYQPPDGNQDELQAQVFSPTVRSAAWQKEIDAAEANYLPGTFTTFFAWEWTSNVPSSSGIRNLHRNVISNATAGEAATFRPFSNADSLDPEDLWAFLAETTERTGVDFVAIPHNSNISGGLMFPEVDSGSQPIDATYAQNRMRWELLVEVTQTKGTSEVHPALAPTDEFAEFEIRRKLLAGQPTPPDKSDYVRSALLRGMGFEASLGTNPYKFGLIGATDNHIGIATVEEDNFLGKIASDAKISSHLPGDGPPVIFPAWEMSASGLTAVWAEENTRESIFAAFKRKEVYGTSGPRIALRVFGGFDFNARDARAEDLAGRGYDKGVPMGGDLTAAPRGKSPGLLIHAAKDAMGANLDRVQVIKGWIDAGGQEQERIYDVVWSGERTRDAEGNLPAVGNTVDIGTATYTNDIGTTQLTTVWTDPDFDPSLMAFYYVRVLEIPTPRQSLYDAVALGIDVSVTGQPATLQERAYSSPIWYTP